MGEPVEHALMVRQGVDPGVRFNWFVCLNGSMVTTTQAAAPEKTLRYTIGLRHSLLWNHGTTLFHTFKCVPGKCNFLSNVHVYSVVVIYIIFLP